MLDSLLVFISCVVVVSKAICEYQMQIVHEILHRFILYCVKLVLHRPKIHGLLNDSVIVRSLKYSKRNNRFKLVPKMFFKVNFYVWS